MGFIDLNQLKATYETRKFDIRKRLEEFKLFGKQASREDLFTEMAYCICTPQNPFPNCQKAVDELMQKGLLFSGDEDIVSFFLKKNKVRFPNNKAKYIIQAKAKVYESGCKYDIKDLVNKLFTMPQKEARDYLASWSGPRILGLAMKESSHFLRNIGHGDDLALLDSHILNDLVRFGVISDVPKSIKFEKYIEIEEKMRIWCKGLGITLGEMDILLWSNGTEKIWK